MNETRGIRLIDGSAAAGPEDLFRRLEELGIEVRTVGHPPVFTVQEAKEHRGELPGTHTKSLFLRNRKGRMWLVVATEDRTIDLKDLASRLDAGRLSFGSPARLARMLGVIPGAVSPFAVLNDRGREVTVVLDREILDREPLNFHPLDNAFTTAIGVREFLQFLQAERHPATAIDFDRPPGGEPEPI